MKKLLVLSVVAFILYSVSVIAGFGSTEVYHNREVLVYSGDTMWTIAAECSAPGEDVREVIYRIREANNLARYDLQPGQKLIVPMKVNINDGLMIAEAGSNG